MALVNGMDVFLLGMVVASALWAMRRGWVREVIALAGWIVAIILPGMVSEPLVSWIASRGWPFSLGDHLVPMLVFTMVLILFAVAGRVARRWHVLGAFSPWDRVVGLGLGMVRGGLIVLVAIVLHESMGAPASRWTGDSWVVAQGRAGIVHMVRSLPEDWAVGVHWRRMGLDDL
ncbi:MAG: CvpA family protein [Magnetococcales bacterium]|nr:CvpA family protein [Magnetococcales bacterium]